jgi:micrococcal nuclease
MIYALALIWVVASLGSESTTIPQAKPFTPHATTTSASTVNQPQTADLYQVVKIVDGDTITVSKDGKSKTLRLIGIDTPETVDPRKPVECFGLEASNKAKELLSGQQVRLEADPSQGELDKYQRTLRYVFLPDGTSFNKMMIERGYAYEYTYNLPYKYQAEFKEAEQAAKIAKRGLWADNACIEPPVVPVTPVVPVIVPDGQYICSHNAYNCADFKTQAEAQATFEGCGGVANDIHQLDRDRDGRVCESLP